MKRPSPALLVSFLALFVALSGTGYAVSKLPENSVGNSQLKNNSVTSSEVKNGSLRASDFKSGQLPAGAKGDVGAQGAPGPTGATGSSGVLANAYSTSTFTSFGETDTEITSLSGGPDEPITVGSDAKLFVQATAAFDSADEPVVFCSLMLDGTTQIGQSWTNIDASELGSLAMSGVTTVAAGTYDVSLECRTGNVGDSASAATATLTVLAVPD